MSFWADCFSWCIQLEAFEIGSDMLSICCKLAWLQFLLKFCNMIKVPSHELFPNPPWSKYINKFPFNTKIWCVSNKMLRGGRNIYSLREYLLLIGWARSRDLNTVFSLVGKISRRAPPGSQRVAEKIDLNIWLILVLYEATPATKDSSHNRRGFINMLNLLLGKWPVMQCYIS